MLLRACPRNRSIAQQFVLVLLLLLAVVGTSFAKGKTILDFSAELGLTADQSAKIRTTLLNHKAKLQQAESSLQQAEAAARKGINAGESVEALRPKLERSRDCRVELRYLDIETARTLEETLTKAQRDYWTKIQNRETNHK